MTEDLFINWAIFSPEEKDRIIALREEGNYKNFVDMIDTMTPEKEIEIQRLVNSVAPIEDATESKVKEKFLKEFPNGPQTPEEEAEMQKALDEEEAERKSKIKETKKSILKSLKNKVEKKETKLK